LFPVDRLFTAVQQRLPQLSGPALALLTASLPQLLPAGGNLRLWRQLGGVVQAQGSKLTAEQLCEVLPLVQVSDMDKGLSAREQQQYVCIVRWYSKERKTCAAATGTPATTRLC
jgi:hypothetical protein